MAVEVVRPHVLAEHDVVVEVDELLGEAGDAVDVGLDGRGAEGGQVALVLEDVLGTPKCNVFIRITICTALRTGLTFVETLDK